MLGALNRFISRLDSDSPNPSAGPGLFGFQVLRNGNPSLTIEPWFDFIIEINGRQIDEPSPNLFTQEVRNCAGNTVTLGIWSAKGQRVRELAIPVPTSPPSLGLALQWTPLSSTEDVWHILEVAPNSPADNAGLLPYGDYIIGSPSGVVKGEAGLGELVEDHLSRPLPLQVYNHEYNVTRLVTIHPSRHWGGSGALGCVLGYGALHRLPPPLTEPPQAPGETLFDTAPARFSNEEARPPRDSLSEKRGSPFRPSTNTSSPFPPPSSTSEFLISASQLAGILPPPASSSSPHPPHHPPRKSHHRGAPAGARGAISPSRGMDDYFREGEEKSREEDRPPSVKPGSGVPPPPRAGPPPPRAGASAVAEKEAEGSGSGEGSGS